MKGLRRASLVPCSAVLFLLTACIEKPAPPPPPPPPEVQAAIALAKSVFVSNVGEDEVAAANLPGGANACYNTFYASLQQWGHYKLVGSPKDANLVFYISATQRHWEQIGLTPRAGHENEANVIRYPVIITLKVDDNLTRSTLWTTQVQFLSTANTQKTKLKQFNQVMEILTDRLKAMTPGPYATPSS